MPYLFHRFNLSWCVIDWNVCSNIWNTKQIILETLEVSHNIYKLMISTDMKDG